MVTSALYLYVIFQIVLTLFFFELFLLSKALFDMELVEFCLCSLLIFLCGFRMFTGVVLIIGCLAWRIGRRLVRSICGNDGMSILMHAQFYRKIVSLILRCVFY